MAPDALSPVIAFLSSPSHASQPNILYLTATTKPTGCRPETTSHPSEQALNYQQALDARLDPPKLTISTVRFGETGDQDPDQAYTVLDTNKRLSP